MDSSVFNLLRDHHPVGKALKIWMPGSTLRDADSEGLEMMLGELGIES